MPARVLDQRRRRVETHRLGGEDRRVKMLGRVNLEPRGGVDDVRERKRVRLGETEVREGLELIEDAFARERVDPVLFHARHKFSLKGFHALEATLGTHRSAQLVSACPRQASGVRGNAHELLLKEGHPEGLAQHRFEERVQVGDRLTSRTPTQIGVDRMPLNGAGAHECYFDDDVVETAWFEARQRVHLRARLDLKHTHGVGGAEQVVDTRVFFWQSMQPQRLIPASTQRARCPPAQVRIRRSIRSNVVGL